MSSWLRSSQQELCRENKSSLTASLSHTEPLFHAAGYNRSSCALKSDLDFKYVISPDHNEAAQAIDIPLMSKMCDIARRFAITFSYWNKRLQKFKLNDVFSVYRVHIFVEALQLHHKSPDSHSWQQHGGLLEIRPNSQIRQKYLKNSAVMSNLFLRDERQPVLWEGKQHGIIMPHGSCSRMRKFHLCCSDLISMCSLVLLFSFSEGHFCKFGFKK